MNPLKFSIKAKTVESYLYGGYLFLLMEDGRILYVSYHRLIHMLSEHYPQFDKLIKLAFLHNEYFKSQAVQLILGIEELQESIRKLWSRASKEILFEIDFDEIEPYCRSMGEWKDIPLDVYMYDLRMYVANKAGVWEARLNPDFDSKYYPLNPSKFEKCFGTKVVSLNARAGKVVLSADRDGLFYGNALVDNNRINIEEDSNIPIRSLRTGWSDFDLINYESSSDFLYLANETADIEGSSNARFRFGDKLERKEIVNFATSRFEMGAMMDKANIKKEDVRYTFNSMGRSFFLMDDGSFINIRIKKSENEPVQYSSVSKAMPTLAGQGARMKPLKSAIVPNGCVVELFDKVVLYQNNAATILEEEPSYNIRTYMGSKNYRDIVTVTKEDAVSFHSVDVFDTIKSTKLFPNMIA